jgi:hypothetical protein
MRIDGKADPSSLAAHSAEATQLLCAGEIDALANKFGYAVAYHREPAAAIREDLSRCLAEINASSLVLGVEPATVKYFQSDASGLYALVECLAVADNGRHVLIELVVAGDSVKHMTLEDISAA